MALARSMPRPARQGARHADEPAGTLVEGTDAWLLEDLTETYFTAEDARPREGGLADELNATPGTLAWSNKGKAAEARKAAAEARKRKRARRQRRKGRKAAEGGS